MASGQMAAGQMRAGRMKAKSWGGMAALAKGRPGKGAPRSHQRLGEAGI